MSIDNENKKISLDIFQNIEKILILQLTVLNKCRKDYDNPRKERHKNHYGEYCDTYEDYFYYEVSEFKPHELRHDNNYAFLIAVYYGHLKTVKYFVKYGGINAEDVMTKYKGYNTKFSKEYYDEDYDMVDCYKLEDCVGKNAFHISIINHRFKVMRYFLKHLLTPEHVTSENNLALTLAEKNNEILNYLTWYINNKK